MTIEQFVRRMPKVEINLQFEGAVPSETLIVIAEQNDVPLKNKRFKNWLKQLETLDYTNLPELIRETSNWIQQPEDFTRIVYEIGVALAKQNVQYAEIGFAPHLYASSGLTFEQLLTALNDGRERVHRAWNVQLRWVLNAMRDEPQAIDDVIKWASGSAGIKGGIVGIGLIGREVRGWTDTVERAFRTAQKKGLSSTITLLDGTASPDLLLERFEPRRIEVGLATASDQSAVRLLTDRSVFVGLTPVQSVAKGSIATYGEFPLRQLVDDGARVYLGAGMPNFYRTLLIKEYMAAIQDANLTVRELEQISSNAVDASFMGDEDKATLRQSFTEICAALRDELNLDAEATLSR